MDETRERLQKQIMTELNDYGAVSDDILLRSIDEIVCREGRQHHFSLNRKLQYRRDIFNAIRGLDIIDVSDVLSVDLPNNIEYYYHRAGRTGRNFKDGNSYIFYDSDHIKMCLKLLENGLIADYFKFSKDYNELVSDTPINKRSQHRTKRLNEDLEKEIKKAVFEAKGKKVKPGYKKKVRNAVERVKKRYKREIIKQDIRRQRVERYKNNGK